MYVCMFLILTSSTSFCRDRIVLISKASRYPVPVSNTRHLTSGRMNKAYRPLLASPHIRCYGNPHRGYAMFIGRVLRGALKVRYLLLGGAVGSGVTLQKVIIDTKIP